MWLAQVLLEERRPDDAEAEIRQGIDASKADPDRWITLVRFVVLTRQAEKAEKAVREAEAHLSATPLALAQCCQMVGSIYTAADADRARTWYDQARQWFGKAQADVKDPNDLTVKRRFAEFLLQTNQVAEAEGLLKEILARAADGKSPDLAAWARRSLAQVYAIARPPRTAEALALFADTPGGAGADAGRPARPGLDPRGAGDSGGPPAGHRRPRDADRPRGRRRPRTGAGWPSSWTPPANGPGPASSSAS